MLTSQEQKQKQELEDQILQMAKEKEDIKSNEHYVQMEITLEKTVQQTAFVFAFSNSEARWARKESQQRTNHQNWVDEGAMT